MDDTIHLEDDLVDRIRADDQAAFARLYNEYRQRLFYYVYKLTNDSFQSLSIVNETFEKLWVLRQNFRKANDLRAFMYVTARNASYDFLRYASSPKRKIEVTAGDLDHFPDQSESPDQVNNLVIETELYAKLYRELENLPDRQQQLIRMVLEEKSHEEIAGALGINTIAVRQLKKRAIVNLRRRLLPVVIWWLFFDA